MTRPTRWLAALAAAGACTGLALPAGASAARPAHHGGTPLVLRHRHVGTGRRQRSATRAPRVTAQPAAISVTTGSVASFSAAASGLPAPAVQWQRSTNRGRNWTSIAGARGATYSFTAAATQSGYEYRALFTNSAGSATSAAAKLTVTTTAPPVTPPPLTPPPSTTAPTITANPANESVTAGAGASFSAAAGGTPPPSVQWQVSTDGGSSWSDVAGASADSYELSAPSADNGYQYRAIFTNSAGSATTSAATLTVTAAAPSGPVVTSNPVDDTVADGDSASFDATASGSPAPSVQWQLSSDGGESWNNIGGASSDSYSFTSSAGENGYEYRAVFTNDLSSATSSAATLTLADQSTNWSGYYSSGGPFSAVTGSWTVPAVSCSGATTYSSQWIGIDGAGSNTVEQDGTEADCYDGGTYYGAWYEMYGDNAVADGNEVPLSSSTYPVEAGDAMSAAVSLSGSTWTLEIADATRNWHYSIGIAQPSPAPSQASAEWIVERPEVCSESCELANLSQFVSVGFTAATATSGSTTGPISDFHPSAIEMMDNSYASVLASPGPLDTTGEQFTDSWLASS
jgi:hypothetical protein